MTFYKQGPQIILPKQGVPEAARNISHLAGSPPLPMSPLLWMPFLPGSSPFIIPTTESNRKGTDFRLRLLELSPPPTCRTWVHVFNLSELHFLSVSFKKISLSRREDIILSQISPSPTFSHLGKQSHLSDQAPNQGSLLHSPLSFQTYNPSASALSSASKINCKLFKFLPFPLIPPLSKSPVLLSGYFNDLLTGFLASTPALYNPCTI